MSLVQHTEPEVVPDVVVEEEAPTVLNLQRRLRIIFGLGIAGLLLMAWLFIQSQTRASQIDSLIATNNSQQVLIDKLATQLDAARAQGAAVPAPEVVAAAVPGAVVSPVEAPAPGLPGERGDAGAAGETGAAGVGVAGSQGDTGSTGSQGATGAQGDTGETGSQGQPGSAGATGTQGDSGPAGVQGDPGVAGPQGPAGLIGPQGPAGPPGPAPQTMTCTPSNPLDLSQPWSCVVTS